MSINSVSSGGGGLSWSVSGKDTNGDGIVTKAEFMAPVAEGQTTITPASIPGSGTLADKLNSLADQFSKFDKNGDGVLTADEMDLTLDPNAKKPNQTSQTDSAGNNSSDNTDASLAQNSAFLANLQGQAVAAKQQAAVTA